MSRQPTLLDGIWDAGLFVWSITDGLWTKQPILKSWGRRYGVWMGLGRQDSWTAPITRSWLRTVLPPYMRGIGVNIALGHNSLRIGLYKVLGKFEVDDYDDIDVDAELEALGWGLRDESVEVIAAWTQESRPETEAKPRCEPSLSSSTTVV